MTSPTSRRRDRLMMLVAAAAFLCAVAFGLIQRWQFVGTLNDLGHQSLTGTTIVGVENWERDGFWNDRGSLVEIPASIEFRGLEDRSLYVSYPPGAQIEILLLKKLLPGADTTTLVHLFGLANQIAIALVCYLIATSLAVQASIVWRRFFGAAAAVLYLLLPIPYYWHATVFFADQAVILPFALATYLEALIRTRPRPWHFWMASVVLGAMAYIDWLVVPFTIVLFGFRLLSPLPAGPRSLAKQAAQIFLGPAIAISIHLANVLYLHKASTLLDRFLFRTGASTGGAAYVNDFFQQFFVAYLGHATTILIGITTTFFVVRLVLNRRDQVAVIALVGIAACLLQVLLLRNHSVNHSFAALKFMLPLCYATFALLPLSLLELVTGRSAPRRYLPRLAACLMGLFAAGYLLVERSGWQDLFPPRILTNGEIARWLRAHAQHDDVFVSSEFDIEGFPSQFMAISRKFVWKFDAAPALRSFVDKLPAGAALHLIQGAGERGCAESALGETIAVTGEYSVIRVRAPLPDLADCMYPDGGPA